MSVREGIQGERKKGKKTHDSLSSFLHRRDNGRPSSRNDRRWEVATDDNWNGGASGTGGCLWSEGRFRLGKGQVGVAPEGEEVGEDEAGPAGELCSVYGD
jgi:hypothetical protein